MSKPFKGVRILDFTQYLSGPYGTYQLALLGADVLKVEPLQGDDTRVSMIDKESPRRKMSPSYIAINSNKRSITLNLKCPAAVEVVKRMALDVDVVCENFRPGVMERLGLGYEALAGVNPRLVYCSLSGFGHTGPQKAMAAFDGKIQAMSGIMSLTGEEASGPMRAGFALCDLIGGINSAFAVASALYQRTHTGRGQFVDVAMLDSTLSFLTTEIAEYTVTGYRHRQRGNLTISRRVTGNRFKVGGGYLVLAALTEKQFAALLHTIGRADALGDARFKDWSTRAQHEPALRKIIEDAMACDTPEIWAQRLTEADVPCGSILNIEEVLVHEQLKHREVLQEVRMAEGTFTVAGNGFRLQHGSGGIDRPPARLGEHTREILKEFGYDEAAITHLGRVGAIGPEKAAEVPAA